MSQINFSLSWVLKVVKKPAQLSQRSSLFLFLLTVWLPLSWPDVRVPPRSKETKMLLKRFGSTETQATSGHTRNFACRILSVVLIGGERSWMKPPGWQKTFDKTEQSSQICISNSTTIALMFWKLISKNIILLQIPVTTLKTVFVSLS